MLKLIKKAFLEINPFSKKLLEIFLLAPIVLQIISVAEFIKYKIIDDLEVLKSAQMYLKQSVSLYAVIVITILLFDLYVSKKQN